MSKDKRRKSRYCNNGVKRSSRNMFLPRPIGPLIVEGEISLGTFYSIPWQIISPSGSLFKVRGPRFSTSVSHSKQCTFFREFLLTPTLDTLFVVPTRSPSVTVVVNPFLVHPFCYTTLFWNIGYLLVQYDFLDIFSCLPSDHNFFSSQLTLSLPLFSFLLLFTMSNFRLTILRGSWSEVDG